MLHSNMAEMPPEDALVLRFLLRLDGQKNDAEREQSAREMHNALVMADLRRQSGM